VLGVCGGKAMLIWARRNGVSLQVNDSGKPTQNA